MYAIISTGGKQERVEEGSVVTVELLGTSDGAEVNFTPLWRTMIAPALTSVPSKTLTPNL